MNKKLIAERLADPDVRLVAVTKFHSPEEIEELASLGVTHFGENRVQEFLTKYDPDKGYHWHLIGHLQTNKVKQVVGKVDIIESVDSIRLAREIERQAARQGIVQPILAEVKISTDESKHGLSPEDLEEFLKTVSEMEHVSIRGLMGIGTLTEDPEVTRQEFRFLKSLYDQYGRDYPFETLSMGMSGDYPIAIEEGSNEVRIGTALFRDEESSHS